MLTSIAIDNASAVLPDPGLPPIIIKFPLNLNFTNPNGFIEATSNLITYGSVYQTGTNFIQPDTNANAIISYFNNNLFNFCDSSLNPFISVYNRLTSNDYNTAVNLASFGNALGYTSSTLITLDSKGFEGYGQITTNIDNQDILYIYSSNTTITSQTVTSSSNVSLTGANVSLVVSNTAIASIKYAIEFANLCASKVVSKRGVATI